MSYHNCDNRKQLSARTGYSTVTIWKWEKKGIPHGTQAILQIQTNGELKADLSGLKA